MKKGKILNPYQRLMEEALEFSDKVEYPKTKSMWVYPKDKLSKDYYLLADLYERVAAAEQLGYVTILVATGQGLEVKYQENRPKRPWNWSR